MDDEQDLEARLEAVKESLRAETSQTIELDWDYRSELSKEQIVQIMEGNWGEVESDLADLNHDWLFDVVDQAKVDAVREHRHELEEIDPDKSIEDWVSEFDSEGVFEDLFTDVNLAGLVNQSGLCKVQIRAMENKDGDVAVPVSHFNAISSGGYSFANTCPVGKLVEVLELDAQAVKDALVERGWYNGEFSGDPDEVAFIEANRRESEQAAVKLDELITELENTTSDWNHLTFLAQADLNDWENDDPRFVTVPQGNLCGLYDPFNGGGSVLGMELLKPVRLDLDDPTVELWADCAARYGVDDVFGLTSAAWGGELGVELAPNPVEVKHCDDTVELSWNARQQLLHVKGSGKVELADVKGWLSVTGDVEVKAESATLLSCWNRSHAMVHSVQEARAYQNAKAYVGIAESEVCAWDRSQVEVAQTEADCKVSSSADARIAVGFHCGDPDLVATVGVSSLSEETLQLFMNYRVEDVKTQRSQNKGIN